MSRITDYGALSTTQTDDVLAIVDVHDTTMDPTGTTKKITVANLTAAETTRAQTAEALKLAIAQNLADLQSASAARANLGLTGAATASLPLSLANGGTGQATQQAGLDAIAGAVTAGQVLAGNGTHVTLRALAVTDLPSLATTFTFSSTGAAPSSGTYTAGQLLADQNGVVRVCTAGGTPGTWARAGAPPWQFWVDDYGAKGDGKIVGDGAMTSGTATLTSATAGFTAGDVGKNIVVNGALGSSSAPLYTTILSFTNSTTVVLNANATNTVSSAAAFWASDDAPAIVLAITAAKTYALAAQFKCQVMFSNKSYGLATLTTTAASGSLAQQNALVPIPYPNVNGTTTKLSFELVGVGHNAVEQYFRSTIPSMTGTCLVATVAASGTSPSIIGGPNASTNLTGTWANTKAIIRGIAVWSGWNTGWIGFDLSQCSACWIDDAQAQVLAPAGGGQNPGLGTIPTNSAGWGFIFPANNDAGAGRLLVEGYYRGVGISPRTTIEKLFTQANGYAVFARTVNATVVHGARIGYWSCQICTVAIRSGGTSGTMPLVIDMLDSAGAVTTDLDDANGTLVGSINWFHDVSTAPNVTAGSAMKITNLRASPGYWSSAPSVPASTTAQQNTAWRDAYVIVTGGTVSDITVDGHSTGLTSGMVTVPSGKTITITYSVAPTWNWWLL